MSFTFLGFLIGFFCIIRLRNENARLSNELNAIKRQGDGYLYSSVFNESGIVIKTTFQEKIEEGHIVKVHTYGLNKNEPSRYEIEHIRTEENYKKTTAELGEIGAIQGDISFNRERIWSLKTMEKHG